MKSNKGFNQWGNVRVAGHWGVGVNGRQDIIKKKNVMI